MIVSPMASFQCIDLLCHQHFVFLWVEVENFLSLNQLIFEGQCKFAFVDDLNNKISYLLFILLLPHLKIGNQMIKLSLILSDFWFDFFPFDAILFDCAFYCFVELSVFISLAEEPVSLLFLLCTLCFWVNTILRSLLN